MTLTDSQGGKATLANGRRVAIRATGAPNSEQRWAFDNFAANVLQLTDYQNSVWYNNFQIDAAGFPEAAVSAVVKGSGNVSVEQLNAIEGKSPRIPTIHLKNRDPKGL